MANVSAKTTEVIQSLPTYNSKNRWDSWIPQSVYVLPIRKIELIGWFIALGLFPTYADALDLPEWQNGVFSQNIGDPNNGITGQYLLNVDEQHAGGVMYAREHLKFKPSDVGLPLAAFKKREDRWDRLYMSRMLFTLDQAEVIEFKVPPALSSSVSVWFPFIPTEVRAEAVLSNGVVMEGGVKIEKNKKPMQRYDARREITITERTQKFYPSGSSDSPPRNQAGIEFRNHYLGEGTQFYNCHCISSQEAGPITHAKLSLSGDPGDPENEPVVGYVSFSQPVYVVNAHFQATRPYGTNRKIGGKREATFECTTTLGKVIRTLQEVSVTPVRN